MLERVLPGTGFDWWKRFVAQPAFASATSLLVVLALSSWAWAPLVTPGLIITHDGQQAVWLYQVDRCFQDGQLPCRWFQDMSFGYGLPLFNYLAPLPYYVAEVLHLLGFPILDALKAAFILGFLLSAAFMFLFARELWGNLGGMLAALFYVYAPYHALDVYVRGDLGEHFAIAVFPGVLWGIYKVVKEGALSQVFLLSLLSALLVLSHVVLTMIFFPVAVLWAVILLWQTKAVRRLYKLALAEVYALALAAFFVLPVLLERDLAHIDEVATGYFDFRNHFAFWDQLFLSRSWGYGLSVPGRQDGMSFQIGWLHWALLGPALIELPLAYRRRQLAIVAVILFFVLFWAGVLMAHEWSQPIWEAISDLKWVQFPWRFLAVAILTSSVLAGAVVAATGRTPWLSVLLFCLLAGGVIGLNQSFFRVGGTLATNDRDNFSGHRLESQTAPVGGGIYYLPITAPRPPRVPARSEVLVIRGRASVSPIRDGSDSLSFRATAYTPSALRVAIFDFPNWTVRVDDDIVDHGREQETGAITFDLATGTHEVALSLEDTAVRSVGNYLSLSSWAFFALVGVGWAARTTLRVSQRARGD